MTRISHSEWFFIIALLLFAVGLRFVGITFGQPESSHFPSYTPKQLLHQNSYFHPDEFLFITSPLRMILTKQPNPKFFENPSFLINLNYVTYWMTDSGHGMTHEERATLNGRSYAPFPLYFIGRVYSALGGVVTVATSYAIARRIVGQFGAAVSGMLVAVSLPLVQHAHYATTSSLATGFVMVAIWASFVSLQAKRGRFLLFMFSGVSAGFAAGNRYNAAAVAIIVLIVGLVLIYRSRTMTTLRRVVIGWLLFPCAFVVSTPHIIFDPDTFTHDFRYITSQYVLGTGVQFPVSPWQGLGLEYRYLIVFGLGLPATCVALVAIIPIWRSFPGWHRLFTNNSTALYVLILLAYIIPYSYVVLRTVRPDLADQILLPVIPVFALITGIGAAWLYSKLPVSWCVVSALLLLMTISIPLVSSLQLVRQLSQPDTRQFLENWVYQRLPDGSTVHLDGPYNLTLDEAKFSWTQNYGSDLIHLAELQARGVDYVVLSDAYYHEILRGGEVYPVEYRHEIASYLETYSRLPIVAAVSRPVWIGYDWMGHSPSYYHNPGLTVYCLNARACQAVG